MPITTGGDLRERSPAYRGAQLAFSSPSATGSRGVPVAASRVGTSNPRVAGDDGRDNVTKHQQNNATSSYIAANLAARLSVERLPLPLSGSPLPNSGSRPAPSRAHNDMTVQTKSHKPAIHTLISRYEGNGAQMRQEALQYSLKKRLPSLNTQKTASVDDGTGISHWTRTKASPARSPSRSTDHSSYTSESDEQLPRLRTTHLTSPSAKPLSKPVGVVVLNTPNKPRPTLSSSTIPQLSVSSLANAMVASSLASSRAPSPTRPPVLPPRRRHSRPRLFHRTHSGENQVGPRTPSPSKGAMKTTMRAPQDPSQDLGFKQKRNHLIHKHPNKHHEGSRKRWRDQIAESERKRYEGVWAANRGLLLAHQHPNGRSSWVGVHGSNSVLNLIVRDIWSRSHLPSSILEEVWKLVTSDNDEAGMLGKEEFVVGMWLVDQALKGRKLPGKVSDSVWFSARGLSGIKVRRRH